MQRNEERREREPGKRRVAELWKADNEKSAREKGENEGARTVQRVTQGLICSSFCSFAAIVSASRRVLKVPIRTRNTVPVPLGGTSTYAEYPFELNRLAIASASPRTLTAAT